MPENRVMDPDVPEATDPAEAPGAVEIVDRSADYQTLVDRRLAEYRDLSRDNVTITTPDLGWFRLRTARLRSWMQRPTVEKGLVAAPLFPFALFTADAANGGPPGTVAVLGFFGTLAALAIQPPFFIALYLMRDVPPPTLTIRADLHAASLDYAAAVQELTRAGDPNALAAVLFHEPRVKRLCTLASDTTTGYADRATAIDELHAITARAWAVAELERRRTAVTEAIVTVEPEPTPDPEISDFTDLDAAGATIATETADLAREYDVALPEIATPRATEVETFDVYDHDRYCRPCSTDLSVEDFTEHRNWSSETCGACGHNALVVAGALRTCTVCGASSYPGSTAACDYNPADDPW